MGTTTIWGMNNSTQIILRGYFTTQSTGIYDKIYTSNKNIVSQTTISNYMNIFQEMAEEWWFEKKYDMVRERLGFPALRVRK